MKKNGFVFIETIITVVILSATLLMLYNSYSSAISNEKDRLVYDDVAYIYRANQVRKFLYANTNLLTMKDYAFQNTYIKNIGYAYTSDGLNNFDTMFTEEQRQNNMPMELQRIFTNFHIQQIVLVKKDFILNCFNETDICLVSLNGLSDNLKNYLKSLNEATAKYYLVFEFAEKEENGLVTSCSPNFDHFCHSYYTSLKI